MSEILLTIIVPHYGTPHLLRRCIDSVPQRDDVQLIVIEDTERRGAGWARNVGLEQAEGEWITFVDADDYLPADFPVVLDMIASCTDEDILFFRNKAVLSDDASRPSRRENYESCFKRYFKRGDESALRYQMASLWGKFFRRSFVARHQLRCDELRWSNDTFFSLRAGYEARSIAVFKQIAYVLTEHEGSLTADRSRSMEEWQTRYQVLLRKRDYLLERHQPRWADEYMWPLKRLLFINFRQFLREMKALRGTPYFCRSLFKVTALAIYGLCTGKER